MGFFPIALLACNLVGVYARNMKIPCLLLALLAAVTLLFLILMFGASSAILHLWVLGTYLLIMAVCLLGYGLWLARHSAPKPLEPQNAPPQRKLTATEKAEVAAIKKRLEH